MNCEQVVLGLSAYIKILKNIFQRRVGETQRMTITSC